MGQPRKRKRTGVLRRSTKTPGRRWYSYPYRVDINLVTEERVERLERVREVRGDSNATLTIQQLVDEIARDLGVYDAPPEEVKGRRTRR